MNDKLWAWQVADQLRGQISAAGYEIEDTLNGPQIRLAKAEGVVG